MKPKSIMVIAGEPSGDILAAELLADLRPLLAVAQPGPAADFQILRTSLEPRFFGAGGPRLAAAGADLALDLTSHTVVGLSDVMKHLLKFRRIFAHLLGLALREQPDVIICVDFSGFNRRFAHAVRQHVRAHTDWFHNWAPRIVQYVSPQVWASREGRAWQLARDYDLLLSIFPFERDWYAARVPGLRVDFVGHPLLDRYPEPRQARIPSTGSAAPTILLLPGSRPSELALHLPVLIGALARIRAVYPGLRASMVLPHDTLLRQAKNLGLPQEIDAHAGGLAEALGRADIALASTGTVTLECAFFGVPTVALYKTSWANYQIGKRIVTVKYLSMPNLLAGEAVFPEFIQNAASAENLSRAAIDLLRNPERQIEIRAKLSRVVGSLGGPGASRRAARAIVSLL